MAFAPASMTLYALAGPTPPSTSIQGLTPASLHICLMAAIFSTWDSMNFWPPKPGFTDITRMRSTSESTYLRQSMGVPGLSTTPDLQPRSRICASVRCRWIVAAPSACTEMMSLPALAKSATRSSGSTIMRCVSSTLSVTGRRASTTSGPMVMLGTKRPSITSMWIHSAPALSTACTSSPSLAKLALRMDGDTMTLFLSQASTLALLHTCRWPRRAARRGSATRDGVDSIFAAIGEARGPAKVGGAC
mmetsp:Transcript_22958/g.78164  ORF Transcript_22958/g.78164 Transcript_22958/m.78164 type:complete len:247 (+) Transcript_22958:184-924(+)